MTLPPQTLQGAIFGFSDNMENVIVYNHIFVIFQLYVYRSKGKGFLSVMSFLDLKMKMKEIEKENSLYFAHYKAC